MKPFIAIPRTESPKIAPFSTHSTLSHHTAPFCHYSLLYFSQFETCESINFKNFIIYYYCMCMCVYVRVQICANQVNAHTTCSGGQRTTFGSCFFPVALGSRNRTQFIRLVCQAVLNPLSHFTGPHILTSVCFHCKTTSF